MLLWMIFNFVVQWNCEEFGHTTMSLSINFESVILSSVSLLQCKFCNWTIQSLIISRASFLSENNWSTRHRLNQVRSLTGDIRLGNPLLQQKYIRFLEGGYIAISNPEVVTWEPIGASLYDLRLRSCLDV
mgnify:CR=1 FL=1